MAEGWRADQQRRRVSSLLGAAAVLLWVGSFVPWIAPGEALVRWDASGLQGVNGGEAPFFLVYGVVASLLAAQAVIGRLEPVAGEAIVLSGVAGMHLGSLKNSADAVVMSTIDNPMMGEASIGAGLYITMAGIAFVVIAFVVLLARGDTRSSQASTQERR